MPWVRVTLNFATDKYSWSEAHIFFTSSTNPIQSAQAPAFQLSAVRVPLLGVGAQLLRIRLATYPASRQVLDLYPPFIVSVPVWPADPTGLLYSASRPFEALLAQGQAPDGSSKNIYVSGVPASMIQTAPADQLGIQWGRCPDFSPRAAAYVSFLIAQPSSWGWATRRDSVPIQVQGLVTNAAFPAMIGVVVNAAIPNIQVGSQVLMKNFRRINVKIPKLGAIWTIGGVLAPVAPSTQWTYFLLNSGAVSLTNYKAMGQILAIVYTARMYNAIQWVEATSRKRGGSQLRPRGRSRSRI